MAGRLSRKKMLPVCDELAKGRSLREICRSGDMPGYTTVMEAVQRDEELHEMYVKARAIGAEVLADEMIELARAPLDNVDSKLASAEVQRRRVQIDTYKWCFARMQPRGIRNKAEDVPANNVITLNWGGGTDEAVQQKPAEVIRLVKDDAGDA